MHEVLNESLKLKRTKFSGGMEISNARSDVEKHWWAMIKWFIIYDHSRNFSDSAFCQNI